jgi:gliding motility-associated-like protein
VVSGSGSPLSYMFAQPGEYTVTQRVFNPATCKQTDVISKKITVKQATPVSVDPVPRICFGASTRLRASGGVKYEWSPVTGLDDPTSATPVASPAQTTDYRVRITNSFGCVQELRTRVDVNGEVSADFDVIISSECGKPNRVRLVNKSQNAKRYLWLTGNGGPADAAENPEEYEYSKPGEYEITLSSSNDDCGTSTKKRVRVEDPKDPPNVITPNGDKKNELFMLPNPGWKLEVYDRWGKIVYSSESYQNDWGNDVPAGVYYYRITSPLGASCKRWLHVLK